MQLSTDRLMIRPITAEDWPAVREIWAELAPLPMAQYDKPHHTDPETVRARIARWAAFSAAGTEHMFFAACLEGIVIGYIAFNRRDNEHEVGYSFHPAFHGKGYAKEALAAILSRLGSMGFTRFSAGTALNNTPSVKLLTSLGFRLSATEKVSFYKDNAGQDIVFDGGLFELDLAP
ncbi:MAG: GNAT family N-acetyltransferase [Clostridia bacterium]|nr:GNAT family N-acetyltransferase [Clostridia bacterium]